MTIGVLCVGGFWGLGGLYQCTGAGEKPNGGRLES